MKPSKDQFLNLKKQRSFNGFVFAVVLAACLCQQCFANPIAMDFGSIMVGTEDNPGLMRHVVQVITIDFLIDLSVLIVGFIMIRKTGCLKTLRFIPYLLIVIIGGLAIDEFGIIFRDILHWGPLAMFVLIFLLLFGFSFFLCMMFYGLPYKEAGIIAILMGLLTHPDFYSTFTWLSVGGFLLLLLYFSLTRKLPLPQKPAFKPQRWSQANQPAKTNQSKTEPCCPAREIGQIALELSRLAVDPESDQAKKEIIQLGRKLDLLPRISSNSNLVYAFRTVLEFLGEKEAQKVALVWEENGWYVRKWMSEDLYIL